MMTDMMMTTKTQSEVAPGDILNQSVIGVPQYQVITHLLDLDRVRNWRAHAQIDWARAKVVRRHIADVNGEIRRLAAYLARYGCHLAVEPEPYDRFEGLTLSVWICRGQRVLVAIKWRRGAAIRIDERDGGDGLYHYAKARTDCVVRRIQTMVDAIEKRRAEERAVSAEKYLESLPEELRTVAQAVRPECIRIASNGAVIEAFHDCGGSMASAADPDLTVEKLVARQAEHDEVYHRGGPTRIIS